MVQVRINLRLQNYLLIIVLVTVPVISLAYDISIVSRSVPIAWIQVWVLHEMDALQLAFCIIAAIASSTFFYMALVYSDIRKRKADKYLSSLIFYSAIYQGISYLLEIVYMFSGSTYDINGLVYIGFKMFMPLGILALLFFTFMAMEVFIKPLGMEKTSRRTERGIMGLQVSGFIIGVIIVLFIYVPDGSWFEYLVGSIGFSLFGVTVIFVVLTIVRIFRIRDTSQDITNMRALFSIGIQLSLLLAVTMLMVLVEMGSFLGLPGLAGSTMRVMRAGLSLGIAILYHFSFIEPSTSKT